jgi:hypothetical protein
MAGTRLCDYQQSVESIAIFHLASKFNELRRGKGSGGSQRPERFDPRSHRIDADFDSGR